jgi:hypothetical protein
VDNPVFILCKFTASALPSSDCGSLTVFMAVSSFDYLLDYKSLFLRMSMAFRTARPCDGSLIPSAESRIYTRSIDEAVRVRRQLTSVLPSEGVCSGSLLGLVIGVRVTFVRLFNGFPVVFLAAFFFELQVGLQVDFLTFNNSLDGGSLIGLLFGCLSDCDPLFSHVNGFPGSSLDGLLVRLHVVLRVSFLTSVDDLRGGLLVGLLVGLHVSFLTHVHGFSDGSLDGLLVRLCISLILVDDFLGTLFTIFHIILRLSFVTSVNGFPGGSLVQLLLGLRDSLTLVDSFHDSSLDGLLVVLHITLTLVGGFSSSPSSDYLSD